MSIDFVHEQEKGAAGDILAQWSIKGNIQNPLQYSNAMQCNAM
jgi:hypothetical protein